MSDGARRSWLARSSDWSTGQQVAFALLVIVAMGGITTVVIQSLKDDSGGGQSQPNPAPLATITSGAPELVTGSSPSSTEPDPTRPAPSAVTEPEVLIATTLAEVVPSASYDALAVLESITVENEHRGGYDRDLFGGWSDIDGDGCDARAEVLIAESVDAAQVDPAGCGIVAGDWMSTYDAAWITDPADLDIDHVVALKEAWESGAWAWSPERRMAYANDLTDKRTLRAVTSRSNESKGEKDPSNWVPLDAAVCQYVADWVSIKARWGMSMDDSEWRRVRNIFQGDCVGTVIEGWATVA